MKKADASGARFAVIVGDDEAQSGEISIKPLREAAVQVRVGLAEAADLLKRA
jgi:histidyl-tRNA synthetase